MGFGAGFPVDFVTGAIVFGDEGKLPIEKVCLLLKHSVSREPWQETNNDNNLALLQEQHSILKFEALNLLGSIGKAIPSVCPERVLRVSDFNDETSTISLILDYVNSYS